MVGKMRNAESVEWTVNFLQRRLRGAIAPMDRPHGGTPTAKKLWGDAPKSPPHELCYVAVIRSQKVQ